MRKAAYIATISNSEPIEGKDRIRYFSLKDLGWKVIGAADLKIGQKVVYIEYDTIISEENQWAEFLRKRCYSPKYRGFKISAMSMAGKISYGLIITCEDIYSTIQKWKQENNSTSPAVQPEYLPDGYDLSTILNIKTIDDSIEFDSKQQNQQPKMTKWQRFVKKYAYFIWKFFYYRKPESNAFPSQAAIKTDETRIQNLTYLFSDQYKDMPIYVTEKIDGSSATFSFYKNRFIISSRNVKQYDQPIKKALKEIVSSNYMKFKNDFIDIACRYSIPLALQKFTKYFNCKGITVQGELAGPGIQKNKLKLKTNVLFIFNVFDPDKRRYLNWGLIREFSNFSGIPMVPLKEITTFKWNNISELEDYVKENFENSVYPSDQPREGLVFRKYEDDIYLPNAENGMTGCFSFKVINPDFILNDN